MGDYASYIAEDFLRSYNEPPKAYSNLQYLLRHYGTKRIIIQYDLLTGVCDVVELIPGILGMNLRLGTVGDIMKQLTFTRS